MRRGQRLILFAAGRVAQHAARQPDPVPGRFMIRLKTLILILIATLVFGHSIPLKAQELVSLLQPLASSDFAGKSAAIAAIAGSGSPRASIVLQALNDGELFVGKTDRRMVILDGTEATDAATGAPVPVVERGVLEKVGINNKLRRDLRAALGNLTLLNPDPAKRLLAADSLLKSHDPSALSSLDRALTIETDGRVKHKLILARAAILLSGDRPDVLKIAAIDTIRSHGGRDAVSLLTGLAAQNGPVGAAAKRALEQVEAELKLWNAVQNLVYGFSLGSVLFLAAIGLAITFGVMGVINMAHGEMVMIGAYVAFVVQQLIAASAPSLGEISILLAIPLAFLSCGLLGIGIERSLIRFLYGRPLETLLATFGLSLILQQAVRSIFGPTNREVTTPSWMSGSVELGQLTLTINRLSIIVFALAVFVVLLLVIRVTRFGLQVRAVTQNREMAAAMGIPTGRIDALTFGLGSGIAGIAGVALSQIDNVSPNLGQAYIIGSFLVVVFGGVGNLFGTLVAAFILGGLNKLLEPIAGAVLGKILLLVIVVLFIQRRPRGLFPLKGRAVEA
jgi:urea transport system permease protein